MKILQIAARLPLNGVSLPPCATNMGRPNLGTSEVFLKKKNHSVGDG